MADFSYTFFSQPSSLWNDVLALRMNVFVAEMDVPAALELDEYDIHAIHLSVRAAEKTIGTLRLVMAEDSVKIGRFAIDSDYRRQGLGTKMMQETFDWCRQKGISQMSLGSQTYITPFYESLGFIKQGKIYMDARIPHILMMYSLP